MYLCWYVIKEQVGVWHPSWNGQLSELWLAGLLPAMPPLCAITPRTCARSTGGAHVFHLIIARLIRVSLWRVVRLLCHQPTSIHWGRGRQRQEGRKKDGMNQRKKDWRNKERQDWKKDRKKESKKESVSPDRIGNVSEVFTERCLLPKPCLHLSLKLLSRVPNCLVNKPRLMTENYSSATFGWVNHRLIYILWGWED